jgi:hypothetical protein
MPMIAHWDFHGNSRRPKIIKIKLIIIISYSQRLSRGSLEISVGKFQIWGSTAEIPEEPIAHKGIKMNVGRV